MKREFVSTIYLIHEQKLLFVWHKKFSKWLPPGGHLESDELPHLGALRELEEETGLEGEILLDEHHWFSEMNASSIPRPFQVVLEEIPPYQDRPSHQHIDFVFVGRPKGNLLPKGTEQAKWWDQGELDHLLEKNLIFHDTFQTSIKILDWSYGR